MGNTSYGDRYTFIPEDSGIDPDVGSRDAGRQFRCCAARAENKGHGMGVEDMVRLAGIRARIQERHRAVSVRV